MSTFKVGDKVVLTPEATLISPKLAGRIFTVIMIDNEEEPSIYGESDGSRGWFYTSNIMPYAPPQPDATPLSDEDMLRRALARVKAENAYLIEALLVIRDYETGGTAQDTLAWVRNHVAETLANIGYDDGSDGE